MIEGIIISEPKIIKNPLGDIHRAIKLGDDGYHGFGECYFTEVMFQKTKGWKKHLKMYLNLVVVFGKVKFVIYDDRKGSHTQGQFQEVILSKEDHYCRLTVPPGVWMAFHGLSDKNIVMNFAQIEHDPTESINKDLKDLSYDF